MQIDQTNYESFLLSYVDRELTDAEILELEVFCAGHPEAARELALLKQTVSVPAMTVFENKASLYREEQQRPVIGWYFRRAAIVIVLLAGTLFLYRKWQPENGSEPPPAAMAQSKATGLETEKSHSGSGDSMNRTATAVPSKSSIVVAGQVVKTAFVSAKKEKLPETGPASGGRLPLAGHKRKNNFLFQEKKTDQTAEENTAVAGEEEFPVIAARAKQISVTTVRTRADLSGNIINTAVDKNSAEAIPPGRLPEQNQVAVIDAASDAETMAGNADDAVSILHMKKNGATVGKLFRRLTGNKDSNDQPGNSGDRKVNISIFQFAVGK